MLKVYLQNLGWCNFRGIPSGWWGGGRGGRFIPAVVFLIPARKLSI